jgi:WD40 repeat protein
VKPSMIGQLTRLIVPVLITFCLIGLEFDGPVVGAELPCQVAAMAWAVDGQALAIAYQQKVVVWRPTDDTQGALSVVAQLPYDDAPSLAWRPDGKALAYARFDGVIHVVDATAIQPNQDLAVMRGHLGAVNAIAFNPEGTILASASDDLLVRLWDAATGKTLLSLKKHRARVTAVAFQADGKTLISGGEDKLVLLWDVATGRSPSNPQGHQGTIMAIDAGEEAFLTAGMDGSFRVWSLRGEPIQVIDGDVPVVAIGWWKNGWLVALADGEIQRWEAGVLKQQIRGPIGKVAFATQGGMVAVAAGCEVKIYNLLDGQIVENISLEGR